MTRILFVVLFLIGCSYSVKTVKAPLPPANEVPWCFAADVRWKQKTASGGLKDITVKAKGCFALQVSCQKASKLASQYALLADITNVTECTINGN